MYGEVPAAKRAGQPHHHRFLCHIQHHLDAVMMSGDLVQHGCKPLRSLVHRPNPQLILDGQQHGLHIWGAGSGFGANHRDEPNESQLLE